MRSPDRRTGAPQSVTRVIQLLEALCAASTPLSLAEMARELDMPKSSLAALLRGLGETGMVAIADGSYVLGPRAFGLGSALVEARRRVHSSDLVREGMRRLAEKTGETVLYAVLDRDGETLTYVDVVESQNAVRFASQIGDRRPLYCTAGGRALLAALPEDDVATYFKRLKPEPPAAATETNKRELAKAVDAVRKDGVAKTIDQAADGVTGIAAVIRNAAGDALGALILAAPTSRHPDGTYRLEQMVRDGANDISESLGFRAAGTR